MVANHPAPYVSRRRVVQGAGVAGLGLLVGCGRWPGETARQAQPPTTSARVGILGAAPAAAGHAAFTQALDGLGWIAGQNTVLEFRANEDSQNRLPQLAAELVRLPVDVIVAANVGAALAAKSATSTIPIIMITGSDPVGRGLVASVARPGGNVTGLSQFDGRMNNKRLQLLQEALPGAARIAVLRDPTDSVGGLQGVQIAAETLGLELLPLEPSGPEVFESAFEAATRHHADALFHLGGWFAHRQEIVELSAKSRLPAMYLFRDFTDIGGLMFYGPNTLDLWRRAATFVDKVLRGAKPADLPVEQPTTYDFVINLKTAQSLGLTIPQHVLLQATELIQ
jgi:putative tryptophan/tyrosine transport system substrate-binding protein